MPFNLRKPDGFEIDFLRDVDDVSTEEIATTAAAALINADDAELWTKFNCLEIEAIGNLFRRLGHPKTADTIAQRHAKGDHPEDWHHGVA